MLSPSPSLPSSCTIYDTAAWSSAQVEEVGLANFEEMLVDDFDAVEWDKVLGTNWNQWDEELVV